MEGIQIFFKTLVGGVMIKVIKAALVIFLLDLCGYSFCFFGVYIGAPRLWCDGFECVLCLVLVRGNMVWPNSNIDNS